MTFYSDLAQTALNLIQEYGQAASIVPVTRSANPATGVVTDTEGTAQSFYVVEVEAEHAFGGTLENVDLEANYLLADTTYAMNIGQRITYGGKTFTITKIKPLNPAGTVLLYGLEVKS